MLFCSVYKFFGGHIGIAAVRKSVFEALDTYRLHPAPSTAPGKLETGTQSHEAIASIVPAVDFIAGLGTGSTRRERLVSGFERIERHENALAEIIRQGLADVPGLTLYQSEGPKTATVAFTLEGQQPGDVCRKLCDRYGIFAADGDYYAETLAHRVGERFRVIQGRRRPDRRLGQGRIRPVQHRRGSGTACQGRPRNHSRITSVISLKVKKI